MLQKSLITFLSLVVSVSNTAQEFYNVVRYGARNDSSQLATDAIRKAIEAASKVGGGTVYFPAGKYLTGPIHLKSNITIFIDAGAELHFSDNFDHYLPMVPSRWEGTDVTNFSPLFYAFVRFCTLSVFGQAVVNIYASSGNAGCNKILETNSKFIISPLHTES